MDDDDEDEVSAALPELRPARRPLTKKAMEATAATTARTAMSWSPSPVNTSAGSSMGRRLTAQPTRPEERLMNSGGLRE